MGKYTLDFTASEINERLGKLDNMPISKTLLWENASPSSIFEAQTINLDLSKYDEVHIESTMYRGNGTIRTNIIRMGYVGYLLEIVEALSENATYITGRSASVNKTGVEFGGGGYEYITTGTRTANGSYAVPLRIYGIKGVQ